MKTLISLTAVFAATTALAAAPPPVGTWRHAVTPALDIPADQPLTLSGETDGERVEAIIDLNKADRSIASIAVRQDGQLLLTPPSSWTGLNGASRAWIEERGALTTVVVEGTANAKAWRLALEYHPEQLWLRRVSRVGENRDSFTYFDREDLAPSKPMIRHAAYRGLD
jgi:hypothetical protein